MSVKNAEEEMNKMKSDINSEKVVDKNNTTDIKSDDFIERFMNLPENQKMLKEFNHAAEIKDRQHVLEHIKNSDLESVRKWKDLAETDLKAEEKKL